MLADCLPGACLSEAQSSSPNSPPLLPRSAASPRHIRPAVIVVNTWSAALGALDGNSPGECRPLMRRLFALASEHSLAILVLANGALVAESPQGELGLGLQLQAGGGGVATM